MDAATRSVGFRTIGLVRRARDDGDGDGEDDTAIEPAFVLELIALIYEAAMDSARWPAFLDAFERRYPGSGKGLWYEHATDSAVNLLSTSGFDPVAMDEYARHYASLNPWTEPPRLSRRPQL
jgi:hypothetical protein